MMLHLLDRYRGKGAVMLAGTGEAPSALAFYKGCVFQVFDPIRNFFVDYYGHPVFEDGVQLMDIVCLRYDLSGKE